MNFENWQYHESKLPTDKIEKAKYLSELTAQFKEEILSNPAAAKWLSSHKTWDREHFIKSYVNFKAHIIDLGNWYIGKVELIPEFRFRKEVEQALDMLLQKKLFNLECQWRTGNIKLPGIRTSYDFYHWRSNIRHCPFLETVYKEELEILRRFVLKDAFWEDNHDLNDIARGLDYDDITEKDEQGLFDDMPDWYEYYDTYMGTGMLAQLPDVKGHAEERYRRACHEKEQAGKPQAPSLPWVPPPPRNTGKPYNQYDEYCELANNFEDPYFKALLKSKRDEEDLINTIEEEDETWDDYTHYLHNLPNLPPVRGGLGWRKALRWVYQDYLSSVIHADLPTVWEEYTMYSSMGLRAADNEDKDTFKYMADKILQEILDGREWLGEPRDLNF